MERLVATRGSERSVEKVMTLFGTLTINEWNNKKNKELGSYY